MLIDTTLLKMSVLLAVTRDLVLLNLFLAEASPLLPIAQQGREWLLSELFAKYADCLKGHSKQIVLARQIEEFALLMHTILSRQSSPDAAHRFKMLALAKSLIDDLGCVPEGALGNAFMAAYADQAAVTG